MIYLDVVLYNELKKTRSAIEVRLSALDAAIEALQKTQASSLSKINDTYLVCKDILTGQQVSDWVADLKAYGTSSETYANSSRMTTLVNSSDAVGDSDVTETILGWSLDNAMVGAYFGSLTGDTTVSWSALTTADALVSSEEAFCGLLVGNDDAWRLLINNNALRSAIKSNGLLIESRFAAYPKLLTRLQAACTSSTVSCDTAWSSGTKFLYRVVSSKTMSASSRFKITYLDGTQVGGLGSKLIDATHNRFITYAYWDFSDSSARLYVYAF